MPGRPKRKQDLVLLEKMGEEPVRELLESAMPIAEVCRTLGVGKRALMEWLEADPRRARLRSESRARAAHILAEEAIVIADDTAGETQRDRLRVDTRKWLAARWNQAEFAEKPQTAIQLNINGLHLDALKSVNELVQVDNTPDDALPHDDVLPAPEPEPEPEPEPGPGPGPKSP